MEPEDILASKPITFNKKNHLPCNSSEGPPSAEVSPDPVFASLGRWGPDGLLAVLHLGPPAVTHFVLLFPSSCLRFCVQWHPWDGPRLVTVTWAPSEVRVLLLGTEDRIRKPIKLSRIPFSWRSGMLAFPTISPPGRRVERDTATLVLAPTPIRVAAPL